MRKSGMLYFGSELLKNNTIKTNLELNELVYNQICLAYGEDETTYRASLSKIFNNIVLKKFYDYELPENLKRKRRAVKRNTISSYIQFPPPPRKREHSDKKIWEKHNKDGENGENVVLKYLENIYDVAYSVKDYYGYDIYVRNKSEYRYIEVKTMNDSNRYINITKNEYKVANKIENANCYWFYILVLNNSITNSKTHELYIFNDFFGTFGLRGQEEILFKQECIKNDINTVWSHQDFSLQISENVLKKRDEYVKLVNQGELI